MMRVITCLLLAVAVVAAEPEVRVAESGHTVTWREDGHVTEVSFLVEEGLLLGLRAARVDGVALTSNDTLLRPWLAEEFGDDRTMWPLLRFEGIERDGDAVRVRARLLGTRDAAAYRTLFVFAGDRQAVLDHHMEEPLVALKEAADAAEAWVRASEAWKALDAEIEVQREAIRARFAEKGRDPERRLEKLAKKVAPRFATVREKLLATDPARRRAVDAWHTAWDARALEVGCIHRDHYRFAHTRLPAELATVAAARRRARKLLEACAEGGTLVWELAPVRHAVAGWPWRGFKQRFRFSLPEGRGVNVLRTLGTWELGGGAAGTTAINLRYRGLGAIEQTMAGDGAGGVAEAFSTTEVIPGAVGGAPLVSPIIPSQESVGDRGYALRHRTGAWIARMARGAGVQFADYQYRDRAALAIFPERQGSFRALCEAMPGDAVLSHTDEEWFPVTREGATHWQHVVALVHGRPLTVAEHRTRWHEIDEFTRERNAAELDFRRRRALPGVGILTDVGIPQRHRHLAEEQLEGWVRQGVRMIAWHNPGWINGRHQGPAGPPDTGGGICNIYDWVPTADCRESWTAFNRRCAELGVAFYPWIGQTVWADAPFGKRLGGLSEPQRWSLNVPTDSHGPGYGIENLKGNIEDPDFQEAFTAALERTRAAHGFQGLWIDSFQNLMMSQLAWSDGSGTSLQRGWWEWLASWSRRGVGIMAESHASPGLSCSIEVEWKDSPWALRDVWKWMRGTSQRRIAPELRDELCFRISSVRGWLAPDGSPSGVPDFARLAKQYSAALPSMDRPYHLGDERGALWLDFAGDGEGVLFAWVDQALPDGVDAEALDGSGPPTAAVAGTAYRVRADDLLAAFGIARGPLPDCRIGRDGEDPGYVWTVGAPTGAEP